MPEMPEGVIARRVAAYGLAAREETIEVDPSWWGRIYGLIKTERLSGLASAAAGEGSLAVTDEQSEELSALHTDDMMWTLALERALLGIAEAARDDGIDLIVLKGPALAHSFYPDPSWRAFGDIDLLVRTDDWRRSCALLERLGFNRQRPEPRAGFDERYGKAAVHVNAAGLNVDLHRTLVLGPFGLWMQPEELFGRTVPFEVAGVTLRRLDDTAILLHACVHAALGFMDPLLMPARDVAQIAQYGDVDWREVGTLARRWRLRGVVRHAFQTVEDMFGVAPPPEAEAVWQEEIGRRERRALDAYVTRRRTRGGTVRSSLWAVPGVRAKAGLVRAMLLPDHAFLEARTETGARASYVRRWAVPLRWLLRRR